MIEFVEKAHLTSAVSGLTLAPNYMVKDGVEYFVINRVVRSNDIGYEHYHIEQSRRELEEIKEFLIQNGGSYFKLRGEYENPLDMLAEMEKSGHTFCEPDEIFVDCRDNPAHGGGFVDFHGNRCEESAAFRYRIYDEALFEKLREAAKPVIAKSKKRRPAI